jgi:hypothetical protein
MIITLMDTKSTGSSSSKAAVHNQYLANDAAPVKSTTCGDTNGGGVNMYTTSDLTISCLQVLANGGDISLPPQIYKFWLSSYHTR